MMTERKRWNLTVDAGTAEVVRGAAERLGYIVEVGRMHGQGNVSALLRGLASGDVDPEALERALEQERKRPRQVRFEM